MSSIARRVHGLSLYSRRLWRKLGHPKARRGLLLYVNTNGTVLTKRIRRYLEELPFLHVAV